MNRLSHKKILKDFFLILKKWTGRDLNPRPPPCQGQKVSKDKLSEYLEIIKLKGISDSHLQLVKRYLKRYLSYTNHTISKSKSISYFAYIKDKHSVSSYRKEVYQILKFLRHLEVTWTNEIQLPAEPVYYPKHVSKDDIIRTLKYFENNEYKLRFNAIIHLGIDTGMRAEELYQLLISDIDFDNRCICINHNPNNGQSTKTKQSRVSFFTEYTKQVLNEYLTYFNDKNNLTTLFPKRWMEGKFKDTPIRVKHLRKFFSQEWDRRGGPTSIKKILMGHSMKGDVDLMHYNYQSEEDLKKIYDKVMNTENKI